MKPEDFILDARIPKEKPYAEKYPVSAMPAQLVPRVPIVLACNWYVNFDTPVVRKFGPTSRFFVGQRPDLGSIRGRHAVCIKCPQYSDPEAWWDFYNQGREGACVGFASSRMMSHFNRERYDSKWLWNQAKMIDEYPETTPQDPNTGTSVDAAMKILRMKGHKQDKKPAAETNNGIVSYRWALSIDEIRSVLQAPLNDEIQAVPFMNSWGRAYPQITWIPYTVLERLLSEYGEACIVVDKATK